MMAPKKTNANGSWGPPGLHQNPGRGMQPRPVFDSIGLAAIQRESHLPAALSRQVARSPLARLLMTTDPGDLVLDPTCGSGTTAYVVEQWARRWITGDSSRVALALAKHRLMIAKLDYHQLRLLSAEAVARNPTGTWISTPCRSRGNETQATSAGQMSETPHVVSYGENTTSNPGRSRGDETQTSSAAKMNEGTRVLTVKDCVMETAYIKTTTICPTVCTPLEMMGDSVAAPLGARGLRTAVNPTPTNEEVPTLGSVGAIGPIVSLYRLVTFNRMNRVVSAKAATLSR